MENIKNFFPELKIAYTNFTKEQSITNANTLAQGIASSFQTIDIKKKFFAHLFDLVFSEDIDAVINAWCVPVMLEDAIPIANKIDAFRLLLEDKDLPINILNEVLKFIWLTKRAPIDLLSFLEIDVQNSVKISEEIKRILSLSNSDFSSDLENN